MSPELQNYELSLKQKILHGNASHAPARERRSANHCQFLIAKNLWKPREIEWPGFSLLDLYHFAGRRHEINLVLFVAPKPNGLGLVHIPQCFAPPQLLGNKPFHQGALHFRR